MSRIYIPTKPLFSKQRCYTDIGIIHIDAPKIGCHGTNPYICHGYLGKEILDNENLPKHALVAERHTGVGITKQDIIAQDLPLPLREMVPLSLEEEIICYADSFFSKNPKKLNIEKPAAEILAGLARFGESKVKIFRGWMHKFGA